VQQSGTTRLASEEVVLASPMSFTGSAKRIWRITRWEPFYGCEWLTVPLAILLIVAAWMVVASWYSMVFALFGWLVIPYRLVRRSNRKHKAQQLQHRELIGYIGQNGRNYY